MTNEELFTRDAESILAGHKPILDAWKGASYELPPGEMRVLVAAARRWGIKPYKRFGWQGTHFIEFKNWEQAMTDYGSIIDSPHGFESDVRVKRCSSSDNFGSFISHLTALRRVLKAAEADGFCLDELTNALKAFEQAITAAK